MPKQFEHWVMQPVYPVNKRRVDQCEMVFNNSIKGLPSLPASQYETEYIVTADPAKWGSPNRITVAQLREAIERAAEHFSRNS